MMTPNSIADTGFWRRGCVLGWTPQTVNVTSVVGPLLPCGDARCGHGLLAHSEVGPGRCEWAVCRCAGYQWGDAAR